MTGGDECETQHVIVYFTYLFALLFSFFSFSNEIYGKGEGSEGGLSARRGGELRKHEFCEVFSFFISFFLSLFYF